MFVVFAGVFGAVGWALGDYRLLLLFLGSVVLVSGALYWYGIGSSWAWSALESSCRARRLRSTRGSNRSPRGPPVVKPKLYILRDGYPRALSAGRGARGGAALAVSVGLLGVASPAELDGARGTRDRAPAPPRRPRPDDRGGARGRDRRVSRLGGFFQRHCSSCSARSRHHSCTCPFAAPRVRGRPPCRRLCGSPHALADALVRFEAAMELVAFAAHPPRSRLTMTRSPTSAPRRCSRATHRSQNACSGSERSTRSGASGCRPPELRGSKRAWTPEFGAALSQRKMGGVLLSRGLAPRVPSALAGLTSLFGMGRGVSPPL